MPIFISPEIHPDEHPDPKPIRDLMSRPQGMHWPQASTNCAPNITNGQSKLMTYIVRGFFVCLLHKVMVLVYSSFCQS